MVGKLEVLAFAEELADQELELDLAALLGRFVLTPAAAARHLETLWRQELLEPRSPRPHGWRWRRRPGERLEALRFTLTDRGRARLRWSRGIGGITFS